MSFTDFFRKPVSVIFLFLFFFGFLLMSILIFIIYVLLTILGLVCFSFFYGRNLSHQS